MGLGRNVHPQMHALRQGREARNDREAPIFSGVTISCLAELVAEVRFELTAFRL